MLKCKFLAQFNLGIRTFFVELYYTTCDKKCSKFSLQPTTMTSKSVTGILTTKEDTNVVKNRFPDLGTNHISKPVSFSPGEIFT